MTVLFSTLYGSHLYGTNTPTSDLDYKEIVLPSLDDLLFGRGVSNKVQKTNNKSHTRNTADDVDREQVPIQVFIRDFVEGQTYALELAFSVDKTHAGQVVSDEFGDRFHELVKGLRTEFLTSNVKAMMGYVFNQANIYSFKGERLNCAREFRDLLISTMFTDTSAGDDQLQDSLPSPEKSYAEYNEELKAQVEASRNAVMDKFEAFARKYPKYFRISEYDIGQGRMRPCFVLLEKTFPWTNTLSHSIGVADTLINKYGSRADQASESNVDWKAVMHAVRIIDEGIELLETKTITLPRPPEQVARLLQIKRGELPLEPIKDELVQKLDRLKGIADTCGLPSSAGPQFKARLDQFTLGWLKTLYGL